MPRTVNAESYRLKRDAILDVVEELIAEKGYEACTIGDIMVAAGVSKGAFYHYFSNKSAVLTALIERRLGLWQAELAPIAASPRPAMERLVNFLRRLGEAKSGDRTVLLGASAYLYSDENALVYTRIRSAAAARFHPLVRQILDAGQGDGTIQVTDATATAQVVISLAQELADRIGRSLVDIAHGRGDAATLERTGLAYVQAMHRVLDLPTGSIDFLDLAELRQWAAAASAQSISREERP